MSLDAVAHARAAWFAAPDLEARFAAVQALQEQAALRVPWETRKVAIGHLIELIHVSDHPSVRARLIEALGEAQSPMAVPALHAELHHSEATVRRAAVQALGELGMLFAGAVVARWLSARDHRQEPPGMMDAALRALAASGHPDTAHWATTLWEAGEVESATVHLALAEVVSSEGIELATAHLTDPEAAISAALHLSAVRHPELDQLLRPLLHGTDLRCIQVAEALMARTWKPAQDDVVSFIARRVYGRDAGRAARRMRVHPPEALITVFELFCDDHPVGSRERATFLTRMASIGVPDLQAAMFDWMIHTNSPSDIIPILRSACTRHPEMDAQLKRLVKHEDAEVVVYAMRCQVNLGSGRSPADYERPATDPRPAVAQEAVRSVMTLFRDRKGTTRRTTMVGGAKRSTEQLLRQALRDGDAGTRIQAAFAAGNLGLTALSDTLLRLRTDPVKGVRQGAAASLHVLPPSKSLPELLAWLAEEPDADVRVRLGLTVLAALRADASAPPELEAVTKAALSDRDDLRLLALHLHGYAGSPAAVDRLISAAGDHRLATACAALTALGVTRQTRVLPVLEQASQHDDPIRQRRAVEALGQLNTPGAASVLVSVAAGELEPAVRQAALRALAVCPCTALEARQLEPQGPSDPMMYELLEARVAAAGGRLDVAAVDAGLSERFGGVKVSGIHRDALRALRTAHFLDSGITLPEGFDAAPPVVFWAKGLELWMTGLLRPVSQELRSPRGRQALTGATYVWSALEDTTPGWTSRGSKNWKTILSVVQRASRAEANQTWTLRTLAGIVLCFGPLAQRLGLPHRLSQPPGEALGALAHDLVRLSELRNRLTHKATGHAADADRASTRAEAIGRCLRKHF